MEEKSEPAGGRSTRLGQDKVWLALDGQRMILRLAERIQPLVDELCRLSPEFKRMWRDNEIHGAHVSAQFERRSCKQPANGARLEPVFNVETLLPRERAVVRADKRLTRELVQR